MSENTEIYSLQRLPIEPNGNGDFMKHWTCIINPSDTNFRQRIMVNQNVKIHSIGFYGPIDFISEYTVKIHINSDDKSLPWIQFSQIKSGCEVGKIFYVDLPNQFEMIAGKWYNIKFMLQGPRTGTHSFRQKFYHMNCENSQITFTLGEFLPYSTSQMPIIKFTILKQLSSDVFI